MTSETPDIPTQTSIIDAIIHGHEAVRQKANGEPDKGVSGPDSPRAEILLGLPVIPQRWSTIATIKPEVARALVIAMPEQRTIRARHVETFIELIKRGEFKTTHQGIAFNERGQLFDGQHRLLACADSGIALTVQVSFNVPEDAFQAFDRGKPRSLADDLHIMGEAHGATAVNMAAAARILWNLDAGRLPWLSAIKPLTSDILAVCDRHPYLHQTAHESLLMRAAGLSIPQAPVAAFTALFLEAHEAKAQIFMHQLKTGENLAHDAPVMVFREGLKRTNQFRKSVREPFMVKIVRCWNAFYEGRKAGHFTGTLVDGKFPRISGLST